MSEHCQGDVLFVGLDGSRLMKEQKTLREYLFVLLNTTWICGGSVMFTLISSDGFSQ